MTNANHGFVTEMRRRDGTLEKGVAVARIEKDDIPDAELEAAMRDVPKGAFALAGLAVALMLAGWFYVYFFIFVPRGAVG
jgi:hypothetical protein